MTSLGIALRKLRLDRHELLRDMAKKLGVTSAFLSSVETGRKKAPTKLVNKICELYELNDSERQEIVTAAERSMQEVKINLSNVSSSQQEVAVSFAKALSGLTDDDISKIMRVFEARNKKRGDS